MDDYARLVLKEAIAAAKAGQRPRARELLLELVEQDPRNEAAWLWLSGLLPTLNERITTLKTALTINPHNTQAQQQLQKLQTQYAALQTEQAAAFKEQLVEAERLHKAGARPQARAILLQLVGENESNEQAWWLLSQVVTAVPDQIIALENTLTLNPTHTQAQQHLETLRRLQGDTMQLGLHYEKMGEWELAADAYTDAAAHAPTPALRREASTRRHAAELEIKYPGVLTARSTYTWLRLTVGPPLLYSLLIFTQAGLRPLSIPLSAWLGILLVLFGSLLLVGIQNTPLHPFWRTLFGPAGLNQPYVRFLLWSGGLLLTLMPFLVLCVASIIRLQQFTF